MNMSNDALLQSSFTVPEMLIKIRGYLKATRNADAQALLKKAEVKAAESAQLPCLRGWGGHNHKDRSC